MLIIVGPPQWEKNPVTAQCGAGEGGEAAILFVSSSSSSSRLFPNYQAAYDCCKCALVSMDMSSASPARLDGGPVINGGIGRKLIIYPAEGASVVGSVT